MNIWHRCFALWPVKIYDAHARYAGRKVGFVERRRVTWYNFLWHRTDSAWTYRAVPNYEMERK